MNFKSLLNRFVAIIAVVGLVFGAIVTPVYAAVSTAIPTGVCPSCNAAGADLSGKDLSNAGLFKINLEGAKLIGTNLTNASLAYANLKGANLTGAILENAGLFGADLTGATVDLAVLETARLKSTIMPDGSTRTNY